MLAELDLSRPLACDVAIAGAGLAGLVAAAILARRGFSVAVADAAPEVGARGGGTAHRGFWLDGGHRDGADVGDLQIGWRHGQLAAAEAGVAVPLRVVEPRMRVHHRLDEAGDARVAEGAWSGKGFLALARDGLGCPEAKLADFAKALAELASASAAERRAAIPVTLRAWCAEQVPDTELRRVIGALVATIFCERPEEASVGRLMSFFARRDDLPPLLTGYADHPEVGGMQGLHVPFAEAIRARRGRLLLGFAPRAVCFEGERAAGLVAVDEGHRPLGHADAVAAHAGGARGAARRRAAVSAIDEAGLLAQERTFAAAFAAGDLELARGLYHPDVVYLSPTVRLFDWPPRIEGVERTLEFIALTIRSCRNIAYAPQEWACLADGRSAFVRLHFDWDQRGREPLARLRSSYVVIYRYLDGAIAQQELYYDPSGPVEVLGPS